MDADTDRLMMTHCIALSKVSGEAGEYPYAAVICRSNIDRVGVDQHECRTTAM
jgi:tRNA(Arg) A34 adenosine deaminase TadA